MKEFSQRVVSKTTEIEKQVDSLIHEAKVSIWQHNFVTVCAVRVFVHMLVVVERLAELFEYLLLEIPLV